MEESINLQIFTGRHPDEQDTAIDKALTKARDYLATRPWKTPDGRSAFVIGVTVHPYDQVLGYACSISVLGPEEPPR